MTIFGRIHVGRLDSKPITKQDLLRLENKIMARLSELEGILTSIGDTLDKASAEIVAAIAELKKQDPDISAGGQAQLDRLAAVAKALDDLNPEA